MSEPKKVPPEIAAIRLPPKWAWVLYCGEPAIVLVSDVSAYVENTMTSASHIQGWVTYTVGRVYIRHVCSFIVEGPVTLLNLCQTLANVLWTQP